MPFFSLADEIILQICNLVSSLDIDNFALVNKITYRVCHDRIKERQILKHNAKVMASRITCNTPEHSARASGYERWPRMGELIELSYLPKGCALSHVEYLELNGDLKWLQPIDEESAKEAPTWYQGEAASEKQLEELETTVKRLGLQLPKGFLKMMGSNELISRMYLGGDWFGLGSFIRCNPSDDGNGGGYVVRFLGDQQSCGFWSLYMSPDGHYCIVTSVEDVKCWKCADDGPYGNGAIIFEGHEKYKLSDGIPIACDDLKLRFEHSNFEAWLAMRYFGGWCHGTLWKKRELGKRQIEYLEYFRSKARV